MPIEALPRNSSTPNGVTIGSREEVVTLVNEEDREIGVEEKLDCHKRGQLHRAISVNITNRDGNILLQRRAACKYHSGGLWSNSCCSHPYPGEIPVDAASRRLVEELGFQCDLNFSRKIQYSADVGNGLIENEIVHFFEGVYDGPVRPDPNEVDMVKWVSRVELEADLLREPNAYSAWFKTYVATGMI